MMFRWEDPWVLILLAVVPLTYWFRGRGERRTGALRFSALDTVRQTGAGVRTWLSRVPAALGAVGVIAVIVALARPQTGITSETVTTPHPTAPGYHLRALLQDHSPAP